MDGDGGEKAGGVGASVLGSVLPGIDAQFLHACDERRAVDSHAGRGPGVGAGGGAMEEHNGKLVGHRRSKPASTAGRRYPPSRRAMMPGMRAGSSEKPGDH